MGRDRLPRSRSGRFSGFIAFAVRKWIVDRTFAYVHGRFPVCLKSWISISSSKCQFFLIIGFCTITLMGCTVNDSWLK